MSPGRVHDPDAARRRLAKLAKENPAAFDAARRRFANLTDEQRAVLRRELEQAA